MRFTELRRTNRTENRGDTLEFYCDILNELKDKAKICYEPETFEWGMREFGIYDNNGYLLQFGQEMEE
jgi:hypothetical protein